MADTLNQIAFDCFIRSEGAAINARDAGTAGNVERVAVWERERMLLRDVAERIAALTGVSLGQLLGTEAAIDELVDGD